MKTNTDYSKWIGMKVSKTGSTRKNREPKPFKSGLKINTIKNLCENPNTGKPAFSFFEDDSVVDCHVCELITNEKPLK
jgi:hypothetical protein